MWVGTKSYYHLSVNSAEKTELTGMLGRC
jgi:hypothetical protein